MEIFDRGHIAQLRPSAASSGLTSDDALAVLEEFEWLRPERDAERVLVDQLAGALLDRPFRGAAGERRDRRYGSDWEPALDALDAWEEVRRVQ